MAFFKIRELIDALWKLDSKAVDRLCEMRGVSGSGRKAKCEALARSYRGDHRQFIADLRKSDLVFLLQDTSTIDGIDYYLPSAASYSVDELRKLALKAFDRDGVPRQFVALDDNTEEEDWDEDDEDDEGDEAEEDEEEPDVDASHRGDAWRETTERAFRRDPNPPGRRGYQDEAVETVWRAMVPGARPLLHVATGGGKTLIANDLVERWLRQRDGRVLWVTKDWRLLYQAAGDLSRRHGLRARLGRIGGAGSVLHPLSEGSAAVTYSTLQTVGRRNASKALEGVGLVVWDECHWGELAKSGRKLLKAIKNKPGVTLLGLTATPHSDEVSGFLVAYSKSFKELVEEGWLAAPKIVDQVRTGVTWRPQRSLSLGDFGGTSLAELAQDKRRNRLIVEHCRENAGRYGQTILFACNKEHATMLARMLGKEGIAARAIHSDNDEVENRRHLDDFKNQRVSVAVNVVMLTHGVDVPSARTVMLARPTLSDTLYSQMIGRGSRLDPASGKTSFNIVEFTDNLERFAGDLVTAKKFFKGAGTPGSAKAIDPRPKAVPERDPRLLARGHHYDPEGAPTWIPDDSELPEAMRGLWFRKGQTFGFELELTRSGVDTRELQGSEEWRRVAEALRSALAARLGSRVCPKVWEDYQGIGGEKSYDVWNVEFDSSVGWEVTSPVLRDEEGCAEVVKACEALEAEAAWQGLKVNHRTGLHLHVAWKERRPSELRSFLQLVRLFEPALATLVPPSRIAEFDGSRYLVGKPNHFARPISTVISGSLLEGEFDRERIVRCTRADEARYSTVNLVPLFLEGGPSTIEVRMHGGTIDAGKMLLWMSLWQQLLWAATSSPAVPQVPDRGFLEPDGDIVKLARQYLPAPTQAAQAAFLSRLDARRRLVAALWSRHPELQGWLDYARRWDRVRAPEASVSAGRACT